MNSLNGSLLLGNYKYNISTSENDFFLNESSYQSLHNYITSINQMNSDIVNNKGRIMIRPKSSCSKVPSQNKKLFKKENIPFPLPLGNAYEEISLNTKSISKTPKNQFYTYNNHQKSNFEYKQRNKINKEIKSDIINISSNEFQGKTTVNNNYSKNNSTNNQQEYQIQKRIKKIVKDELNKKALQINDISMDFHMSFNFLKVLAKYDKKYSIILNDISEISINYINKLEEKITNENRKFEVTLNIEKSKNQKLKENLNILKSKHLKNKINENPIIPKPFGDNLPDFESTRRTNLHDILINDIEQKINNMQ